MLQTISFFYENKGEELKDKEKTKKSEVVCRIE